MTIPNSLHRETVRAYDQRAIERGIPGPVLMENAGRGAAERFLALGITGPVSIVCGKGNNGGDGFVLARHLRLAHRTVVVELVGTPEELRGDAEVAFRSLPTMGIDVTTIEDFSLERLCQRWRRSEWIVDALLGTGIRGAVRSPFDALIEAINAADRSVLALDIPSGLDADTGQPLGPTVRADHTMTFLARKVGFDYEASLPFTGKVHVVGIGSSDDWVEDSPGTEDI